MHYDFYFDDFISLLPRAFQLVIFTSTCCCFMDFVSQFLVLVFNVGYSFIYLFEDLKT